MKHKIIIYAILLTIIMATSCTNETPQQNFPSSEVLTTEIAYLQFIAIPNDTRTAVPLSIEGLLSSNQLNKTVPVKNETTQHLRQALQQCKIRKAQQATSKNPNLRRGLLFLDTDKKVINSLYIDKTFPQVFGENTLFILNGHQWETDHHETCFPESLWSPNINIKH